MPKNRRGGVLDEVPVGRRKRDAGAALLEIGSAAVVIGMSMPEQHVAHVVRV
jgi:hypothetical protein